MTQMKNQFRSLIGSTALVVALLFSGSAIAFQAPKQAPAKTTTKAAATPAPSDKEIADAQTKGLVWVNTSSKVYHKNGQFYGKTKQGKFMTEADAQKAGYKAAQEPGAAKKKSTTTKK